MRKMSETSELISNEGKRLKATFFFFKEFLKKIKIANYAIMMEILLF